MDEALSGAPYFEIKLPDGCRAGHRTGEAVSAFAELPRTLRMHLMRNMMFCALGLSSEGERRARHVASADRARQGIARAVRVVAAPACPSGLHEEGFAFLHALVAAIDGFGPRLSALVREVDAFTEAARDEGPGPAEAHAYVARIYAVYNGDLIALTEASDAALAAFRRKRGQALEDAFKRASEVASEVNEIAFTVGLIALNAQVEASHAGASGRAFAVIASEIRDLAERAEAASGRNARTLGEMTRMLEG